MNSTLQRTIDRIVATITAIVGRFLGGEGRSPGEQPPGGQPSSPPSSDQPPNSDPIDDPFDRDPDRPDEPCIEFDADLPGGLPEPGHGEDFFDALPGPVTRRQALEPQWNSIALFFEFDGSVDRPDSYQSMTVQKAKEWLDEGNDPASPTISEFMSSYWNTISNGEFSFGVDTPRDDDGDPLVPTISGSDVKPGRWGDLINRCIAANPEAVWEAAGGLRKDGKRWIPSVVLVQPYWAKATAAYGGYSKRFDGHDYLVGDRTHMPYGLKYVVRWAMADDSGAIGDEPPTGSASAGELYYQRSEGRFWYYDDGTRPFGTGPGWSPVTSFEDHGKRAYLSPPTDPTDGETFLSIHVRRGRETVDAKLRRNTASGSDWDQGPVDVSDEFEFETATYRRFWQTLTHEYAHNFLEFGDLYGPHGSTLYWDLLGDASAPGRMSEVSSVHKERISGWNYEFIDVIEGSSEHGYYNSFTLGPYTTTGDALKVIPDPENNPREYFVIEYRGSTGPESWRPDGALTEDGLLITHVNDRITSLMGGSPDDPTWLTRVAPYFDPELANYADRGGAMRTGGGRGKLTGALFDGERYDRFTPLSEPSSDFYGGRSSTLRVTDVERNGNDISFDLSVGPVPHHRVWQTSDSDRGVAGRFRSSNSADPEELFFRNDGRAALLTHRDGQWFVAHLQEESIDDWTLDADDREVVADLDGDGRDEIYVRNDDAAGVLGWDGNRLESVDVQRGRVDDWDLRSNDREFAGDFDGDGREEILVRSDDWVGVIGLTGGDLQLQSIQHESVGDWALAGSDRHYVGRFSRSDRDEILAVGPEEIGLVAWDDAAGELALERLQTGRIDDWNIGSGNRYAIGDFDGDGRDEVYVRSDDWAGVFAWVNGRFALEWIRRDDLRYADDPDDRLPLDSDDESYAGHFFPNPIWLSDSTLQPRPDRDGVLHVADNRLSVLRWVDGEMRVHHARKGRLFEWDGDTGIVVGRFRRDEPDPAYSDRKYAAGTASNVFLHNEWGTGTIGVNHVEFSPNHPKWGRTVRSEMGITWYQEDYLLALDEPAVEIVEPAETADFREDDAVEFSAVLRGVDSPSDVSIEWSARSVGEEDWSPIETTHSGESFSHSFPGEESVLVQAVASVDGERLADLISISFLQETETYLYHEAKSMSGYVYNDSDEVVLGEDTDVLLVGDDEENVGMRPMLHFPLSLPEDLEAISDATLTLSLDKTGDPYSTLGELKVVQVDYGDSVVATDYDLDRADSATALPGMATLDPNRWGTQSVDVTTAVRDAWDNRDERGKRVQFTAYFTRATDGNNQADHVEISAKERYNLLRPTLEVTFENY